MLAGEVFRRVEPEGRTFDEWVKQVLSPKLGGVDWFVSVPESEFHRTVNMEMWGGMHSVVNLCHSKENGNIHGTGFCELMSDSGPAV